MDDGEQTAERVRVWLKTQRDDLINMSRRNRLLYFKHTKAASLEIVMPSGEEVLSRLNRNSAWDFFLPVDSAEEHRRERVRKPTELAVENKTADQLTKALHLLERKTNTEFIDKGVWVLYLGVGALEWAENPQDEADACSPLLLVPVTVGRDSLREPFQLRRTEDDSVINPALAVKLETDFDLTLPSIEEYDETNVDALIEHVRQLVADRPGWSVSSRVVMSTFTFQKEAMYRDLLDNEDLLVNDPMIQLLALGPDSSSAGAFDFAPVPEDELDQRVLPEDLVNVRDADASQRACIVAARDGRSFVMDGPPGSGKSQTITNIIAELLHAGKTVLFVSEKAAALDVVRNRLREAQLDDFVLQLHSHDANRKAVATELDRALTRRPRATDDFTPTSRTDLIRRRQALSSYAQAMNEVRQPLGRSLHQVLGSITALQSTPQAPVPATFGRTLRPDELTHLLDDAATLGRDWGPVIRGHDFLWRDLANTVLSASRQNEIDGALRKAAESLDLLRVLTEEISDELGVGWADSPVDAQRLLEVLTLLDGRPVVPAAWLSSDIIDHVDTRITELAVDTDRYTSANAELNALVGERFADLNADLAAVVRDTMIKLSTGRPSWHPPDEIRIGGLQPVAEFLDSATDRLESISSDAGRIAASFGFNPRGISLARAIELADLGELVGSPTPPEAQWLNPAVQAALSEAVRVLGELVSDFRARQEALRTVFTDDALTLDLRGLHVRFTETHRGLRKLSGAYRQDKRTLAACTVSGRVDRVVRERISDAVAWQELANRLSTAESLHAQLLGDHYYQRGAADFGRISHAIDVARQALELVGDDLGGAAFTNQLSRGGSSDPQLVPLSRRLRASTQAWLSEAANLMNKAEPFRLVPIDQLAAWSATTADRLRELMAAVQHVSSVAGRPATLSLTSQALDQAVEARQFRYSFGDTDDEDTTLLGEQFRGIETDWLTMRKSWEWAVGLRERLGGPVHRRVAEALLGTTATPDELRNALTSWHKATARITSEFTDRRASEVATELQGNYDDIVSLLDELARTVGDIDEWASYADSRSRLEHAGLQSVIAFCAERKVDASLVRPVVERALLEAWADDVLDSDQTRLGTHRAANRDALVEEFRALDRALVASAAARVINACAARRPTSSAGAAGIIKRQAEIQRRHMPIRQLLHKAGGVAQSLKPCFMMSPLSVSQYLPASLRFDIVIFDEASQVKPSDAINCVYRGKQLVVAGDQKQLPPSDFFAKVGATDDDTYDEEQVDEFESLLDLCKGAGALKSLPLNWHYRSEHESLITYSNYRFYDGSLWTFPGATDKAPDVGIELFKVDGVYRRGSTRDNPVEAAKVIERVLHHRLNHPHLTVGVVTFSGAQEDAIERELERQSEQHPELAGLRTDDRLHGFFIKNLENVQGDERDVIIFSVGYGPDEHGKFTLGMGPLNRKAGWRRLNVAITRAKRRVEVITSVLPEQFPNDAASDGVRHLRGYLDFAQRGVSALALDLTDSHGDAESPFEEEVIRAIQGWGFDVTPQVGVAGYRVDIAVRHPEKPGTFALGVECDGAMYHSSKVARDRDRLRQQVLEGLDWRIHRIWGTSWYRDRSGQEERLRAAIDAAVIGRVADRKPVPVDSVVVHQEDVDLGALPSWTTPYQPAEIGHPNTGYEIHEPEARGELRRLIEAVVREESPVHEERVLTAVREAWGKWKSGSRIKEAFDRAVRDLTRSALDRDHRGFLRTKSSGLDTVRVPAEEPSTKRPVKHLPPEELREAVYRFTMDAQLITREELTVRVARLFGWGRRGPDIRAALDDAIDELIDDGRLTAEEDRLTTGG